MEHKHCKLKSSILCMIMLALLSDTSFAMQGPHSLPEQSNLKVDKLLRLRKQSTMDVTDKKQAEIMCLVLSNKYTELDILLNQESYEKIAQHQLSHLITLACSKQAHQTAALLLARCERDSFSPSWITAHEHAFAQAEKYRMVTDFCCSLAKYRQTYPANE